MLFTGLLIFLINVLKLLFLKEKLLTQFLLHQASPPPRDSTWPHTLFNLFVWLPWISDYLNYSTLRLFADNSIIYKEIHSMDDARNLQQDLEATAKWEQDWLMSFHPDKCNITSVTQKKTNKQYSSHINFTAILYKNRFNKISRCHPSVKSQMG